MIRNKTLIIVGAGASSDLGLPVGSGLQRRVFEILTDNRSSLRHYIYEATSRLFGNNGDRAGQALSTAMHYAPRMLTAASIDNFLDQHRDDQELVAVMKIGIAYAIAEAENKSKIGSGAGAAESFIHRTTDYFLFDILNIAVRNHQVCNLDSTLRNLSFVTFNYDRCIERYLESWISYRFGLDSKDLAKFVNITHVYGSLGDYLSGEQRQTFEYSGEFAFQNPHLELPSIAPRIKLFTEQEDSSIREEINSLVREAETIIFLGFGFEEQNMRFFSEGGDKKKVFSTFFGMSRQNTEHLQAKLSAQFCRIFNRVYSSNEKSKHMISDFYHPLTEAVGSI